MTALISMMVERTDKDATINIYKEGLLLTEIQFRTNSTGSVYVPMRELNNRTWIAELVFTPEELARIYYVLEHEKDVK